MNKQNLNIGLFFDVTFPAPSDNNRVIVAPMTMLELLAKRLTKKGHNVFFLVSKDSKSTSYYSRTKQIKSISNNKYLNNLLKSGNRFNRVRLVQMNNQIALADFLKNNNKLDILNVHNANFVAPILMAQKKLPATIITMHDSLKNKEDIEYHQYLINSIEQTDKNINFSFVGKNQSKKLKTKNKHVVYNGINISEYPFNKSSNNCLSFSGRMIQEKGPDIALRVAQKTNNPIKLAGSIPKTPEHKKFWESQAKPLLNKQRKYMGLLPHNKINKLFKKSKALLFPIQWKEAFGLVMIEAMACGTPVIAFNKGAVPEVIKHGKTGFIVKNEKEMIKAVKKIYAMPKNKYTAMRYACRKHVEDNFSVEKMVDNYEKMYYNILKNQKK